MILDKLTEFCDATALAVTTTTNAAVLGNVIDLGTSPTGAVLTNVQGHPGNSEIYLVARVLTAAVSGGSATRAFELRSSTLAALTGGTTTTHASSGAIAVATLAAGYTIFSMELPRGTYQRYLGLFSTNAVETISAGTIDAYLTMEPATAWAPTADGLTK